MANECRKRDKFKTKLPPKRQLLREFGDWESRHNGRYKFALSDGGELDAWCQSHGLSLEIKNQGHHWIVRSPTDKPGVHLVQWWPRTAKLVVRCLWDLGVHCHDVSQVAGEVERILRGEERHEHCRGASKSNRKAMRKFHREYARGN